MTQKNDDFLQINKEKKNYKKKDDRVRINVAFTSEQHKAMKDIAENEGLHLMQVIRKVVKSGLEHIND